MRATGYSFVASDVHTPLPRMARSWTATCQAGIIALGGFFAVIVIAMVTHRSGPWVMVGSLAIPVLVFAAVTAYEWRAGRRLGIELSRLHLIAVAVGLVLWLMYQTAPGSLPFDPTSAQLCLLPATRWTTPVWSKPTRPGSTATSPGGRPAR